MTYSVFDPTGNITAIVTSCVPTAERNRTAAEVMGMEPTVEQLGFLLPGGENYDGELQMAGGEFCGNASMSAAAQLAMDDGMQPGTCRTMILKVSGSLTPVAVDLACVTPACFRGRVAMPLALKVTDLSFQTSGLRAPVVFMEGIIHVILRECFGIERAEALLPAMCGELHADAMGIMLTDEGLTRITPIVYVPGANTLVREHSCASGTAAVGAYLAAKTGKKVRKSFAQPGGTLAVEAVPNGAIFIEGMVTRVKKQNN